MILSFYLPVLGIHYKWSGVLYFLWTRRFNHTCKLSRFSRVRLFATPWSVARQAPLSMGFSRTERSSGLPNPSLGDLLDSGIEPESLTSPALAGQFFTYHCTTCETLCSMGLLLLWDLAWRGSPHLQHDAVTAQGRSSREEEVNQQAHGKVLLQCGISQICWYISGQSNSRDSV